jgi:rhamnosyltransferase subunit B
MRIVLFPLGSAGDVFPFLGLAIQLRERGHDVVVATNAHFEPQVRREGISFEPVGTEEDYLEITRDPDLWDPWRSFGAIVRHSDRIIERQVEICRQYLAKGQGVALANLLSFGVRGARDQMRFPLFTVHLQPGVILSRKAPPVLGNLPAPAWLRRWLLPVGERLVIDRLAGPAINRRQREMGLPPVRRIAHWWNSPDGVICLFPEWFAPPQEDWPQPLVQADFPLWNSGSQQELTPSLEQFLRDGPPPVVFAPGTANVQAGPFFDTSVEACGRLGCRGILLTRFREQVPASLPATVRHVDYAPLDRLLPRSAALVHHGGVGTLSQALAAGVPQLIRPLAHDQFDNLHRVQALGVARGIAVSRYRVPEVVRQLGGLLQSQSIREACAAVQNRLATHRGLELAATAVEELARRAGVCQG